MRLRVICTRPSEVTSATWCLVRSRPKDSTNRRSTKSRFVSSTMSMKSMTMMPPTSRRRSWRTISSAASKLLLVTVCSRLPPWPMNLPVFTSTTVMASVRSITSEPPDGKNTLRSSAFASCSSTRYSSKRSLFETQCWRRSTRSGAIPFIYVVTASHAVSPETTNLFTSSLKMSRTTLMARSGSP